MAWSKQGTCSAMLVLLQVSYAPWASWNQAADPVLSFDARSQSSTASDWFSFKMAKQPGWNWVWDWDLSPQDSDTAEEEPSVQPMASHPCFQWNAEVSQCCTSQVPCGTTWLCAGSWMYPQVPKQISLTQRNIQKYKTLICSIQIQGRLTQVIIISSINKSSESIRNFSLSKNHIGFNYSFVRFILCPRTKPLSLKEKLATEAAVSFTVLVYRTMDFVLSLEKKKRQKNTESLSQIWKVKLTFVKCLFLIRKRQINMIPTRVL